ELAPTLDLLAPSQVGKLNSHGNRRRYIYDNLGRLIEARHELRQGGEGGGSIDVTNPFNDDGIISEKFEWDDNGRLSAWTSDPGNRTEIAYDFAGFVKRKTWPDGSFESFTRDRDGNLQTLVDANGSTIHQEF